MLMDRKGKDIRVMAIVVTVLTCVGPSLSAQSSKVCTVSDPSPTPLNVCERPYGRIVGALHNGAHVYRLRTTTDNRGDDWSYVVPLEGGKAGWVFRDYVVCPEAL